jgi:hypothetical protein
MRAARVDRTVTWFSQMPAGHRLEVELDRVLGPVGGRRGRVVTDDCLHTGRLAAKLGALVLGECLLQAGDSVRRDAAQALLVPVDRGDLRDDATQAAVGGGKNDGVAAGVAGAPQADPSGVDLRPALQEGDRSAPVGDLLPRVDVLARRAAAGAERPVVVHQHHEAIRGEGFGKALQSMLLHTRVAVGHSDSRVRTRALRAVQPAAQGDAAFCGELDVSALRHRSFPSGTSQPVTAKPHVLLALASSRLPVARAGRRREG